MKKLLLISALLSSACYAQLWNGVLPSTHAIDWTQMGVSGGIPSGAWTQCGSTIAAYTGNATTINNALAACGSNQYVLLGPGTFTLSNGIAWTKNNVALRGSGPTQTHIVLSGVNSCQGRNAGICMSATEIDYGGGPDNTANVTAGLTQGSTSITLGANLTGAVKPVVGQVLRIDQLQDSNLRSADNGNIFVCDASGAGGQCTQAGGGGDERNFREQEQLVTVTSITGGTCPCTVGISPAIYMPNWNQTQTPQAWWSNATYATGMGLENLHINANGVTVGSMNAIVSMADTTNSWIKNVIFEAHVAEPTASRTGNVKTIELFQSVHTTIQDSYFYGRLSQDSYAIDPYGACDFLIQNNIFHFMANRIVFEQGCGGAEVYNFDVQSPWGPSGGGQWAQGTHYGHGGQENFELNEGNITYGQEYENYFGHAFFITAFRNRFFGFQNGNNAQSVPAFQYSLNRYFHYIGNVLGTSTHHTHYDILATGNTTSSISDTECGNAVYAIGLGQNCSNGAGTSGSPFNDTVAPATTMRWGNRAVCTGDAKCNTNRFVAAEVPSGDAFYPVSVPANNSLPNSFLYSSKPSWFGSTTWPPIGPDVTGGNVGQCSGGTYDGWPAYRSSDCTGGTLSAGGLNGQVYANPAMQCFFTLGGKPDGSNAVLSNFDAASCYVAGSVPIVSLSPTTLTFATTVVGSQTAAQNVTLTNTGTATLTITSITYPTHYLSGGGSNCGATLGVGLSCTISVIFAPQTTGTLSPSVTIVDNAGGSPHTIPLSGLGTLNPQLNGNSIFAGQGVVK